MHILVDRWFLLSDMLCFFKPQVYIVIISCYDVNLNVLVCILAGG